MRFGGKGRGMKGIKGSIYHIACKIPSYRCFRRCSAGVYTKTKEIYSPFNT